MTTKEQAAEMQTRVNRLASTSVVTSPNGLKTYTRTETSSGTEITMVKAMPGTATTRMQALGRLPGGERNKTEAAYERLLEVRLGAGEIRWFEFEPLNLRLGDNCFYKPDFGVIAADGVFEIHEVKGHWTDDALVKFKAAAYKFPFRFKAVKMVKGKFEIILEI